MHGTAYPSEAAGTPSTSTVAVGAGLMATKVAALKVEVLESTAAGALMFTVSSGTRTTGEMRPMDSPEGSAHATDTLSDALSAACTPSCGHAADAEAGESTALPEPTMGTAAPPATSCGAAAHAMRLPASSAGSDTFAAGDVTEATGAGA